MLLTLCQKRESKAHRSPKRGIWDAPSRIQRQAGKEEGLGRGTSLFRNLAWGVGDSKEDWAPAVTLSSYPQLPEPLELAKVGTDEREASGWALKQLAWPWVTVGPPAGLSWPLGADGDQAVRLYPWWLWVKVETLQKSFSKKKTSPFLLQWTVASRISPLGCHFFLPSSDS